MDFVRKLQLTEKLLPISDDRQYASGGTPGYFTNQNDFFVLGINSPNLSPQLNAQLQAFMMSGFEMNVFNTQFRDYHKIEPWNFRQSGLWIMEQPYWNCFLNSVDPAVNYNVALDGNNLYFISMLVLEVIK